MEIISTEALISINATFFAQLTSFLFFMFVLNKVMVRPLRKIMSKRSLYLDSVQNKIDSSKEQATELRNAMYKNIDDITKSVIEKILDKRLMK